MVLCQMLKKHCDLEKKHDLDIWVLLLPGYRVQHLATSEKSGWTIVVPMAY